MIGALRTRLVLQRPSGAADGGGGAEEAWESVAVVWAEVVLTDMRTADPRGAPRPRSEIRIRRRGDVRPGDRLVDGARVWSVDGLRDAGPHDPYLICLCTEQER